jgi:hypothetical protein
MKRVMCAFVFLGLVAVRSAQPAEACASYKQDPDSGVCRCRYNTSTGYNTCEQVGNSCILTGSNCGGGPTISPF